MGHPTHEFNHRISPWSLWKHSRRGKILNPPFESLLKATFDVSGRLLWFLSGLWEAWVVVKFSTSKSKDNQFSGCGKIWSFIRSFPSCFEQNSFGCTVVMERLASVSSDLMFRRELILLPTLEFTLSARFRDVLAELGWGLGLDLVGRELSQCTSLLMLTAALAFASFVQKENGTELRNLRLTYRT